MPIKATLATYRLHSTIDLAEQLAGTKVARVWSGKQPLALRVLATVRAWRADWSDGDGKESSRLLRTPGGTVYLIDLAEKKYRELPKELARVGSSRSEIAWRDSSNSKVGPVRLGLGYLPISAGAPAIATIEACLIGSGPKMTELWLGLAPWLGNLAETLGLPVRLRLELPGGNGGSAELQLEDFGISDVPDDTFNLSSGLRVRASERRHQIVRRDPEPSRLERPSLAPGTRRLFFSGLGPETVKVVFNQNLIDAAFADVRNASSYLSGFSGSGFLFTTADWFGQVVANAPVPTDGVTRSIIPSLMVRVFLAQIYWQIRRLGLVAPPVVSDLAAAVARQSDSPERTRLLDFLGHIGQEGPALSFLLDQIVPGPGSSAPADDDEAFLKLVVDTDLTELATFGGHPFVRLAVIWYGQLLPSVDIRPKERTRQDIEDSVAVFHQNGEVTLDSLADLVNISINDFQHSISFGARPLFAQPTYLDTAALQLIRQARPWFHNLQDIRFGFSTEFSLAGAELSCDINITPAFTAVTAIMGFFCPACVLSLFMTGGASASVEDARFGALLYVEQDAERLNPPRWRAVLAEPQFGDVETSVFLVGFNVILDILIDVIGNILGSFILQEILKSFGSELSDAVDGLLTTLPPLDAAAISRLGRDPTFPYPVGEESRIAYEAPARAAGGYQFETFRQGTSGSGQPLEFPSAGGTLDAALALVLGPTRAGRLALDLTWPNDFGPLRTRKPDGRLSDVDWWTEVPDLTGMPPRPSQLQSGPPPGALLIPQNVGQSWWGYATILDVSITWLGWRNIVDGPADRPVADVLVSAWCRSEAIETEIISYEECQDVAQLAEGLLDRWRGPRGPLGPVGPAQSLTRGAPTGLLVGGSFLQRRHGPEDSSTSGWADGSTIGYWFDGGAYPRPDDTGPAPIPGTLLCRNIVTLNARQRETWLEASLQFSLPVLVGLTETWTYQDFQNFVFLPAIRAAVSETYPAAADVPLNLFATGPLQTLNLPANRDWIRSLLLSRGTDLAARVGINALGPFHYDYGIGSLPITLRPEQIQSPVAVLRLAKVTTSPAGVPITQVAFKFEFQESLLGRA